ncbi:MAG TPA: hypothetical protein VL172_07340 [Kofleriaceae bacterium]|nr:hypothetical protein [Kofleriaceae bacterium]
MAGGAVADKADLQRDIDVQAAAARDLGTLDKQGAAAGERTALQQWLDDAGQRLQAGKLDLVRDILNRCVAQAELIRQVIGAAKLDGEVADRHKALAASNQRLADTRKALAAAKARRAELEAKK